ncbi:hypothetical protein VNO77_19096 [Canavalia gladiata]|uniref:Uncharacterized protein n=1 Tax=Canavalia gladiata TaxID=3824 RepID=A0AAN9LLT9_CANGL
MQTTSEPIELGYHERQNSICWFATSIIQIFISETVIYSLYEFTHLKKNFASNWSEFIRRTTLFWELPRFPTSIPFKYESETPYLPLCYWYYTPPRFVYIWLNTGPMYPLPSIQVCVSSAQPIDTKETATDGAVRLSGFESALLIIGDYQRRLIRHSPLTVIPDLATDRGRIQTQAKGYRHWPPYGLRGYSKLHKLTWLRILWTIAIRTWL